MANIIQISDFTGRYNISSNAFKDAETQDYLDHYEKQYLTELLGVELYDLFIADLVNGVPQTQIYIDIFNSFAVDRNSCIIKSDGIKELLRGFIFFELMRKVGAKRTISGNTRNLSDNSANITQLDAGLWLFFNEAVDNHYAIQWRSEERV